MAALVFDFLPFFQNTSSSDLASSTSSSSDWIVEDASHHRSQNQIPDYQEEQATVLRASLCSAMVAGARDADVSPTIIGSLPRKEAALVEIHDSIQALFPDRECFTLVLPLNNEAELQRLDQISLNKLRPEFKSGLDALTKFIFERTRPK
ncbi:hypothetical protein G4B88_014502 [Cannabis sativa]|uniref:GB1/RHD3-type G domain-containing protein n=1 Tax=Cannabis sativa TaxID=3483 RepID=A0A7J6I9T4_CANSA|nr:hypothetical protein G4B88_014502 [Cannabis sativa]